MISLEKWMILTPLQKLPNNEGDLGKKIATGPKSKKSPNLVTLVAIKETYLSRTRGFFKV